jgi:hypothetical protein
LATLNTRFKVFTLKTLLAEIDRWVDAGRERNIFIA